MRRKSAFLYLFLLASIPAFAAKHVTVAQVEQLLTSERDKPDAEIFRQLVDMQLTERMSTEKLAKLTAICPGPQSKQTLLSLADSSAFLPSPAAAIPSTPMPDLATQRKMIALVVDYVLKTLPMLPNFFATRVTTMFQETPLQQRVAGGSKPYQPMHLVNGSTVTVLFRDGREVVDAGAVSKAKNTSGSKAQPESPGLTTWGVFGPILGTVIGDAARSNSLAWSHWERTANGEVAVYRYTVPKDKSHYQVKYCCVPKNYSDSQRFEETSGYHGEMSVDPESGTVLRMTLQADLKPTEPIDRADIAVEYGPVEIGGRTYVGPMKSVSISEASKDRKSEFLPEIKQTSLNDVEFRDYHLFRADVNIVTTETPRTNGESAPSLASPSATEVDAALAATPAAPTQRAATPPPPPPAVVEAPEYTLVPADATPHPAPNKAGFVLQASARLVDVGFVAYEKKGRPLTNLTQNDIELFDNGKKQSIQLFYQAAPAMNPPSGSPSRPPLSANTSTDTFTNQAASAPGATPTAVAPSSTVLLMDGVNLAHSDLVFARSETVKFLKKLAPSQPVALYTMDDIGFHVLVEMTQDHALLAAKLQTWMPTAAAVSRAQEAEKRNNQHIDTVMNTYSLGLVNGGDGGDSDSEASVDPQLRDWGANPAREAMRILIAIARHLAPVPGHKSLIWISGDTALIDWSSQKQGTGTYGMKNKYLEEIADKTGEALNQAHISVYPLDASAVLVGGVDASLKNRNVELSQGGADSAAMMASAGGGSGGAMPRNMTNGRDLQAMQTSMYGIQEPVRRIAESTGGKAVGRASDLGHTLDTILSDTQATYMASFKPDTPPDDTFHTILLKVTGKPGVKLRYRTEYLYDKDSQDMKAKFQQAVWRPTDTPDIGLNAKVVSHTPGKIQVMIALKDVALEQQQGRWTGKLDVYVVQRDEDTGRASSSGDGVQLALKESSYESAMKTGFAYERSLNAGPKTKSLRVIVYDENSGRFGSVTLPATALQP